MTPAQTVARSYQRIRDHNDPAVFISLRDEKDALAEAEALTAKDAAQLPLLGVPVAVKDNIDALGCRPPPPARPFPIRRRMMRPRWRSCARPAPSSSARPISISSPPAWSACARPMAFPINPIRARSHSGRIEFGIGGRGVGRPGAAGARHRYRRLRPRAGDAQQHRRPEAEPRADLDRRRGAGLPDAGLRLGVLAHRRRRHDGAGGDGRPRRRRSVFAQPAAGADDARFPPSSGSACRATAS